MAVDFTLSRFPQSGEFCHKQLMQNMPTFCYHMHHCGAGELRDACSLPFACVVQPFAKLQQLTHDSTPVTQAEDVGRCRECYA